MSSPRGGWVVGREGRGDEPEGGGIPGRCIVDGTGEAQAVVSPLAVGISKKDEIRSLIVAIHCKPRYT